MQNMLLTTEYAFASWVHFWTLNGAPTLKFARIPNADGSLVIPEEETIVSAISNYQGNSTDLYIMMGTSCLMHRRSTQHLLTSFRNPNSARRQQLSDGDLQRADDPIQVHAGLHQGKGPCRLDLLVPNRDVCHADRSLVR
jgi:hypothetical protein